MGCTQYKVDFTQAKTFKELVELIKEENANINKEITDMEQNTEGNIQKLSFYYTFQLKSNEVIESLENKRTVGNLNQFVGFVQKFYEQVGIQNKDSLKGAFDDVMNYVKLEVK